jgi:hypothetical protein
MEKTLNTLTSEHLLPGEKPIIACIEGYENQTDEEKNLDGYETIRKKIADAKQNENVENVNYSGNPRYLSKHDFLHNGEYTYVISPVSEKDKLSESYIFCTGVVATGKDKNTGENISVATHQDPNRFLSNGSSHEEFLRDVRTRFNELKERAKEGTIDAVIVGGEFIPGNEDLNQKYRDSVALLGEEVKNIFGFEPAVITGPKTGLGEDNNREHIYFDTKERRLYITRPHTGDATSESYLPSERSEKEKTWE